MIFLKKIEIIGFKSFANKTVINFNKSLIGIVGPNGSGKSNITDAIKWVFGGRLSKYLRTHLNQDVIFNGSNSKVASNYAHVKLLFDNSNKIFNLEYNKVEISRRIFRDNSENEYYINNVKCKLKDIQILAKESGLSQSSLSIISQGNISDFAEAKPYERRLFLEDACGVSKYKYFKSESNKKLELSINNLNRLNDIINEISRKIPKLKKEYELALKHKQITERLKQIEINILVKDITKYQKIEKTNSKSILELNIKKNNLHNNIKDNNAKISTYEKEFNDIITNLTKDNLSYNFSINRITDLKIQRIKLEQNINYNDINDISKKVLIDFNSYKNDLNIENSKIKEVNVFLEKTSIEFDLIVKKQQKLLIIKSNLNKQIANNNNKIIEIKHKISSANKLFYGVETVLKNKNHLQGILCIVKDLIKVNHEYNVAFSTILNNNFQNIIVENKIHAKNAIKFLKNNRAGQAIFIPLDVKIPKQINDNDLFILKTIPEFIDIASNLIEFDLKFKNVILFLLSRHIICVNIDDALKIAKLTNYSYTITTIDGFQIRPYGILSGGFKKNNYEELDVDKYKNNLENLNLINKSLESQLFKIKEEIFCLQNKIDENKLSIIQNNLLLKNLKNNCHILNEKIKNLKQEYDFLNSKIKNVSNQNILDEILNSLKTEELRKEQTSQSIEKLQNNKSQIYEKLNKLKQNIQFQNLELNNLNTQIISIDRENLQNSFLLKECLQILVSSYNMTYDYAKNEFFESKEKNINENEIRKEIKKLKNQLKDIGNINLSSIEEYENENNRYLKLKSEYDSLIESIDLIKNSISKMNKLMINKFTIMIKNINNNLNKTFSKMFNGGNAKLIYSNPDDILNTGIDILVSPPGKKINNINLLSGGEKSLVALSVLFSILESNPLPLVILDEVEAPLDFANLKNFCKYLGNISNNTQFIIITHRTTTMEYCDTLYGVTMQEEGISEIVTVELSDTKNIINDNKNKTKEEKNILI